VFAVGESMFASEPSPRRDTTGSVKLDVATYVVGGLLLVVAAAAWADLILGGSPMPMTTGTGDMNGKGVSPIGALLIGGIAYLIAWTVMMAAMMLPSATPMIALYAALGRGRAKAGPPVPSTMLFTLVYLLIWAAVGIPVYAVTVLVSQMVDSTANLKPLVPDAIAVVLVVAGLYQFTPWKRACLRVCRTPLGFLMSNWQDGYTGALRLAVRHAVSCLGCCLALMVVLVAAGAMGLAWVTLIAAVVFAEKILPYGDWTARTAGVGLVALGLLVATQPGLVPLIQGSSM
jgi:predicted metal-binding membrane protein